MKHHHKHILQWLLILSGFLILSRAIAQWIGVDEIRTFAATYPILAPLIIVVIKAVTIIFAPLSGTATYAIAGTLFPLWEWMLYMSIGNLLGICTTYRLGRRFWLSIIWRMFGSGGVDQTHHIIDRIRQPKTFVITRIVLFPLEDLINYVAGMAKTPFWLFLLVSMTTTSILAFVIMLSTVWIISLHL